MKTRYIVIISAIIFVSNCTHIRRPFLFDDINKAGIGKKVGITLTNGCVFNGKSIQITHDSTSWLDSNTKNTQSIATSQIKSTVLKKSGRGALEGLGLGILSGAITGALIGFVSGDDDPQTVFLPYTAEEKAVGYGVVLGAAGGLLGLPIGAAVGSKDKFLFEDVKK